MANSLCIYADAGGAKLKIGIKKRVENCSAKTRKGDLVHIHYTVGIKKILILEMYDNKKKFIGHT